MLKLSMSAVLRLPFYWLAHVFRRRKPPVDAVTAMLFCYLAREHFSVANELAGWLKESRLAAERRGDRKLAERMGDMLIALNFAIVHGRGAPRTEPDALPRAVRRGIRLPGS